MCYSGFGFSVMGNAFLLTAQSHKDRLLVADHGANVVLSLRLEIGDGSGGASESEGSGDVNSSKQGAGTRMSCSSIPGARTADVIESARRLNSNSSAAVHRRSSTLIGRFSQVVLSSSLLGPANVLHD